MHYNYIDYTNNYINKLIKFLKVLKPSCEIKYISTYFRLIDSNHNNKLTLIIFIIILVFFC